MTARPEILIIIGHYLPGFRAGGPIRTVSNMVHWMGDEFRFKILTSDHDLGKDTPYPNIPTGEWQPVGKASVRYLAADEQGLGSLRHLLNHTSYDLLYLDGTFAPMTLKALLLRKTRQIPHKPLIVVPRGHLHTSALNIKSTKKQLFLRMARLTRFYDDTFWHASTDAEREHIQRELNPRDLSAIWILPNFPTPLDTNENPVAHKPIKRPGELRVVYLSRIAKVKNLDFILNSLSEVQGKIQFDIFGPLEDEDYWHVCQTSINELPAHVTVRYHGEVSSDQVPHILAQYHLFVLPTLGENFGHVVLEALCAGCPVLISDQTPWSKVNEAGAGWALPLDQPARFVDALRTMVALDDAEFNAMVERVHAFGKAYVENPALVDQMQRFFKNVLQTS